MPNIRDLRVRIDSIGNIQKITRAMEMVASTKLRRYQERTTAAQPYSAEIAALVGRLAPSMAGNPEAAGHAAPLFADGPAQKPLSILFVGSDRGLCGSYNSNVQRCLDEQIAAHDGAVQLHVIGRKAMAHAERMGYPVACYHEGLSLERVHFHEARALCLRLIREFRDGSVSDVVLCSTRFASMVKHVPTWSALLPIRPDSIETDAGGDDTILEPGGPELLGSLIPRYLENTVFMALMEAVTSEFAARRMAMKNATDAAGDMKQELNRTYNKVRQEKITSEILEVVTGAEAL